MANSHTTPIQIGFGINTQGFFSYEDPANLQTLVIFVHGFGGNSIGTWDGFPALSVSDNSFRFCDIVYYGYDTFKGQAGDHAAELYAFINSVINPLKNKILPANQNLKERKYARLILVAHSLGAILARQAQLLGEIANKEWVLNSQLALFAPAHHGAEVVPLAKEALSGILGFMAIFAKFRFPILTDLSADDDGIIKSIKAQTEKLQDAGKGDFSKAKLVVYAKGDLVVKSYPYLQDAPPHVIHGVSHTSVCKPNNQFLTPLELLKQII